MNLVKSPLGNYFNWEVMHGDGDHYNNRVTTFTTLDQPIDLEEFETVKELKEFLNTLPEDQQIPELTFSFKIMY